MSQAREHLSNYRSSANLIDRLESAARWNELNSYTKIMQDWQVKPFSDVELMREAANALRELKRSRYEHQADF